LCARHRRGEGREAAAGVWWRERQASGRWEGRRARGPGDGRERWHATSPHRTSKTSRRHRHVERCSRGWCSGTGGARRGHTAGHAWEGRRRETSGHTWQRHVEGRRAGRREGHASRSHARHGPQSGGDTTWLVLREHGVGVGLAFGSVRGCDGVNDGLGFLVADF
jgi:hypothetical protein